ncbi:DUF6461 domain-containing protein [Streptomyces sp. S.PB5]|uniref:DUF6461 domain-containing protein n=1 Tax=Streptomyces sp. S.PB5 TaxID=3020844 RepID=UPI0025AF16B0|nr:DUF6461 domain-containing protein [Streptomyces sp. S.PB5]MDN3022290.1 DUF6461 domain-containing protein [Streptomyces sp. S.PB5]
MTGTTPHATDYAWLREQHDGLLEGYCVTLVDAITPARLLEELGAAPGIRVTGVPALFEPAFEFWDRQDDGDDGDDEMFVGVAALDGWAVMVEIHGCVGVTSSVMGPVSKGRTVVSHCRNINAVDHFTWLADGELLLHFEPLFPSLRDGSGADRFLTEMRESGFEPDEERTSAHRPTESAFALAERITGIRLTAGRFGSLEFVCGAVRAG